MTIDPVNIQTILTSDDWGIGMRRKITFPLLGDGVFTQDGPKWKHSREVLRPQLLRRRYDDLESIQGPVDDLLEILAEKKQQIVNLDPLFFRLTLDVTTNFLFGESICSLRNPDGAFESSFDLASRFIEKRFRFQKLYWLVGGRSFGQACKTVYDFADRFIQRRLAEEADISSTTDEVFVRGLAEHFPYHDDLRGQVFSILTAGRDTTACLLTWTFFHLVRNPRVMQKLRKEIADFDKEDHEIQRSDLLNLKHLQNTLKEGWFGTLAQY
jgi:cytochrome P450